MEKTLKVLETYFGYSQFRPLQQEIVQDVLDKKDVFVLMPTGGGKSLCYQLPSVILKGVTIVVSPLISLMKDQVDALNQNGIKAAYLNSSLTSSEQQTILRLLEQNKLSLLYVAPERLVQESFLQLLKQLPINFFAIDEAHCISQWGHDFRPEYRQLQLLRQHFPTTSVIALTATATPRVRQDIITALSIETAKTYQASFNRPNLTYRIIPKNNPFSQVLEYLTTRPGEAGIIYCNSRKTVESLTERLNQKKIKALAYHAGLPDATRKRNQEAFLRENTDVIVATIAFGMGIDKPNVRFVIHYNLPQSLEHYYQETGRAGRDGLPSDCLFLYSYADKFSQERFIAEKETAEERQLAKAQLHRVLDYAQSKLCRHNLLLQYFAEQTTKANCGSCDNCLSPQETFDGTVISQKILSCVYRVQERFGTSHIIHILTGSQSQKVLQYGHDKLSTYGIIQDHPPGDIKMYLYELIHMGYLTQTQDQYAIVHLTPKSKAVLQGKEKVVLTKPPLRLPKQDKKSQNKTTTTSDPELFQRLRALRKRLADEKNVPPYVIFSDASLKEMITFLPQTTEEFAEIKGVGAQKLEHFGPIFLKEIRHYLAHPQS